MFVYTLLLGVEESLMQCPSAFLLPCFLVPKMIVFKSSLEMHFCLDYQILLIFQVMVQNRGKIHTQLGGASRIGWRLQVVLPGGINSLAGWGWRKQGYVFSIFLVIPGINLNNFKQSGKKPMLQSSQGLPQARELGGFTSCFCCIFCNT